MLRIQRFRLRSRCALMLGALLASTAFVTLATAEQMQLAPQTKLRLSVVQFVASTGDYKRWDALGGDLEVAPDGTLSVPTLGAIDVTGLSAETLGSEISRRLKLKLGLLDAPDATIQVIEYPPVFVVGSVSNPGQFPFRPGMTVVQALALAGGERRVEGTSSLSSTIRLEADLNGFRSDMLRATARLARLESEFARQTEITFPAELDAKDPTTAEIMEQERRIFQSRINEFERQQTGLTQLAELYGVEIDALGQKAKATQEQMDRAQKQVDTVTALVNAGSATVARLTDAQRVLSDLRSDKLDNLIATMTARENLNHSQRDLAKLQDEQQSDASTQLQAEQAGLEKLLLNQDATMRMLRQSVEFDRSTKLAGSMRISLSYTILRQQNGQPATLDASEASILQPGDLIKVTMQMEPPTASATAASLADSGTSPK